MRSFFSACLVTLTLVQGAASQATDASLADLFERVDPAVVTLRTVGRDILAHAPDQPTGVGGIGSGVLIDDQGSILTAAPASAGVATLADSALARVGEPVFVVGAPLGISHTLSVGHLSARRQRDLGLLPQAKQIEFFQTDAAINKGNSGGPLFNMRGEILGIVSHILSTTGGNQGLGFAVTANTVRELLIDGNSFWSGVDAVLLNEKLAGVLNVPDGKLGFLVQHVSKRSPAHDLGLRGGEVLVKLGERELLLGGDIVLSVQGVNVSVETLDEVRAVLNALSPRESLSASVLRAGKITRLDTTFTSPSDGRR